LVLQHLQDRLLDETVENRRMPRARLPPPGLEISTRRTGCGRQVPSSNWARIAGQCSFKYGAS
jgi:hypothetical protein